MLFEKIIKFELRGSKTPGRICAPKTGYFQDKNLKGIFLSELLFTFKIFAGGNVPCFLLTGLSPCKI